MRLIFSTAGTIVVTEGSRHEGFETGRPCQGEEWSEDPAGEEREVEMTIGPNVSALWQPRRRGPFLAYFIIHQTEERTYPYGHEMDRTEERTR